MKKIKILITHDNKDIQKTITDNIKELEYVEIVGYASNRQEAFDAILKYKPDIVFTKFAITDIPMYDLIIKTEKALQDESPIFRYISNDLTNNTTIISYKGTDEGTYASVKEIGIDGILTTLNSYNEIILGQ